MAETPPNQTFAEANERQPEHKVESVVGPPTSTGPEPPPDNNRDNAEKKRRWTKDPGIFWLTLLTLVVLGVYTYYTRQLVVDTEKANIATQRAFMLVRGVHYAKIVGPFASGRIETLENFTNGNVQRSVAEAWNVSVIWENAGNTPAKEVAIETNCAKAPKLITDPFTMRESDPYFRDRTKRIAGYVFGPKQINDAGSCVVDKVTMMTTQWGSTRQFIFGKAKYKDIFNRAHITEFCLELANITGNIHEGELKAKDLGFAPIAGESVFCPAHNCADEECEKQK